MKKILKCQNSLISEAWFVAQGIPAKVEEDEIGSINNEAKKQVEGLKRIPSIVVLPKTEAVHPPFCTSHFTYLNGTKQSRVGHNYLSVHAICDSKNKYIDYNTSIKPEIIRWLGIQNDGILDPARFKLNALSFGYINTFHFAVKTFDISKHFKLNIGLDIQNLNGFMNSLGCTFQFLNPAKNYNTSVRFEVLPTPNDPANLTVRVHTLTEQLGQNNLDISKTDAILKKALELKENSKKSFFDFLTPETTKILDPVYDA